MTRVLVSNDDGVTAPGIRNLYKKLRDEGHDTWVIAPSEERSTTGHSLNLDKPLRLNDVEDQVYSCSGFPADCVLMGIGHVLRNNKPDIIISGINRGANLAQDMYYSGTMAAAREAAFHHYPSIAVSLDCSFFRPDEYHYDTASRIISEFLDVEIQKYIPHFSMLNINVPNVPWEKVKGISKSVLGFRDYSENIEHRIDSRNRDYYWIVGNLEGHRNFDGKSDCELVSENHIAVTPLPLLNREEIDFSELDKVLDEINKKLGF